MPTEVRNFLFLSFSR